MKHKTKIRLGFSEFSKKLYVDTKNKILTELNASEKDWNNPKWQLKNRISDVGEISNYINLTDEEYENIKDVSETYRFAITPYGCSPNKSDSNSTSLLKRSLIGTCFVSL